MAQEEQPEGKISIHEARMETVISLKDGKQQVRLANFLKPCAENVEQAFSISNTPLLSKIFSHSNTEWPSKVIFKIWVKPQKEWEEWVDRLAGKYGAIWNQSNICDSVLSSIYEIRCNRDLILGLMEFWCSETNTFVFPWGEATITLEDVMILGGFSVTGEPVNSPLTEELVNIEKAMEEKLKELQRSKSKRISHAAWLKHFMEEEGELEHVAFLALWLSRYVLLSLPEKNIRNEVFSVAVHLSKGKVLALAPAVLASLYRSLTLLNEQACSHQESIIASGPFQLVQLWIFEHNPILGSASPNVLKLGEPRAARWQKQNPKFSVPFIRSTLKLAENFQWRPYSDNVFNWRHLSYYKIPGDEMIDSLSPDIELQSFLKCLVAMELVGLLGCREKYVPNRVAMQFRLDQDIPGDCWAAIEPENKNFRVYSAQRSSEPGVSERYFKWWKDSKSARDEAVKNIFKQRSGRSTDVSSPAREKIDKGNCKSTSDSSPSSEEVSNGSASSDCDGINNEGKGNDEVSETAGAGKDGDCCVMQEVNVGDESQENFHLDSSEKIKKMVKQDLSDDDDHIILSAKIRTSSPESDTPPGNVDVKVFQDLSDDDGDDFPISSPTTKRNKGLQSEMQSENDARVHIDLSSADDGGGSGEDDEDEDDDVFVKEVVKNKNEAIGLENLFIINDSTEEIIDEEK